MSERSEHSESPESQSRPIAMRMDSVFVDAEGRSHVNGRVMYSTENASPDDIRDFMENKLGADPESIRLKTIDPKEFFGARRQRTVGFRRWNSSWDPKAPASDPTQN